MVRSNRTGEDKNHRTYKYMYTYRVNRNDYINPEGGYGTHIINCSVRLIKFLPDFMSVNIIFVYNLLAGYHTLYNIQT